MDVRIPLAALALVAAPTAPASATVGFTMQGTGTYVPGVSTLPRTQSVSFTGSATVANVEGGTIGPAACTFTGAEEAADSHSIGRWRGGCGTVWCSDWLVVRVALSQTMVCMVGQAGDPVPLSTTCLWTPVNASPTTTFALLCGGVDA